MSIARSGRGATRRRLQLVRLLLRGPAHGSDLIAGVNALEALYTEDKEQAAACFRRDIFVLRLEFACHIAYDRRDGYRLDHPGTLGLIDLSDEALAGLRFLQAARDDGSLPNADQVGIFLDAVLSLLPGERRAGGRPSRVPRLVAVAHATGEPNPMVVRALEAVIGWRRVTFGYRSTRGGGTEVEHQVSPLRFFYEDGRLYLEAFCHAHEGNTRVEAYEEFRVERIVPGSVRAMRDVFPPSLPQRPSIPIRYWLGPRVASRRDVSALFPGTEIHYAPDGSAIVDARAGDLWRARQALMRYRDECRALDPPELVALMREAIIGMADRYGLAVEATAGAADG